MSVALFERSDGDLSASVRKGDRDVILKLSGTAANGQQNFLTRFVVVVAHTERTGSVNGAQSVSTFPVRCRRRQKAQSLRDAWC
jgi:hypothetical protein